MNEAVAFGILASVLYGLNNFVARFANRRNGVAVTLLWSQWLLVAITGLAWVVQERAIAGDLYQWAAMIAYSLSITGATACLYFGLSRGRLSVVVPVMASYGAVSALLSWASGERLTGMIIGCVVVVIIGAVLSAVPAQNAQSGRPSGWRAAAGASVLFGIGYWLQGTYVLPAFGIVTTLGMYNLIAALLVSLWMVSTQQQVRPDTLSGLGLILLTGLLGGGGFAALSLAQSSGNVAIATALSSTSTAVAVALAFIFLREKPGVKSGIGIAAVIGGVVAMHIVN